MQVDKTNKTCSSVLPLEKHNTLRKIPLLFYIPLISHSHSLSYTSYNKIREVKNLQTSCWSQSVTCGCWLSCGCCRCSAPGWALDWDEEGWPEPPSSSRSLNQCQSPRECCLMVVNNAVIHVSFTQSLLILLEQSKYKNRINSHYSWLYLDDVSHKLLWKRDRGLFTLVLPLLQRWLCHDFGVCVRVSETTALLLEVSSAVPAVGILAEPLARPVVNALGISNGGSETILWIHKVSRVRHLSSL